jgi:hypothetical protein
MILRVVEPDSETRKRAGAVTHFFDQEAAITVPSTLTVSPD